MGMEARVAILETLAAQIVGTLADIRKDMHEFRSEMRSGLAGLRSEVSSEIGGLRPEMRSEISGLRSEVHSEISGLRSEVRSDIGDLRRIHDRDFRITFGAIVTTTVGLAALMAHVAHWL